uniref:hydroxyacylglutathione hydrolase n=1 Tax=Leersia perrieri TaxID=77586 RepID=A0A0D9VTM9_9ORYZ
MKIVPVACLQDNYAYLIVDESTKSAAAVDPVEPEKVLAAAGEVGAHIDFVLTTHHHWDHAGGNEKMTQLVPGIKVYGGSLDNVKGCTDQVENGIKLSLGKDIEILCLHTPCHTKGHISYYVTSKEGEDPAVFTGDTLFIAGCGRFFEGTAEQMHQSLCVTLGSLPKPTRVYCGHEYTVQNLKFMLTVEPDNEKMKQKMEWAQKQREANQPTVPSTIGEEFEINTFMRVDLPEIQAKFGAKSPVDAMREVRKIKDNWKASGVGGFTLNGWVDEPANWPKPSCRPGMISLGGANTPNLTAAGSFTLPFFLGFAAVTRVAGSLALPFFPGLAAVKSVFVASSSPALITGLPCPCPSSFGPLS